MVQRAKAPMPSLIRKIQIKPENFGHVGGLGTEAQEARLDHRSGLLSFGGFGVVF